MGAEYGTLDHPTIVVEVHGTAPIVHLEIIRNDRILLTTSTNRLNASFTWVDRCPVSGESFYYLRVTQADGALAWSSPIWVTYSGSAGEAKPNLPLWNSSIYPEERRDSDTDYGPQLGAFLEENGAADRYVDLQQRGVFREHRGRFALFWGLDRAHNNRPMHIHLYLDFPDQRMVIEPGWAAYGVCHPGDKWPLDV
jgi:hypothetical protein